MSEVSKVWNTTELLIKAMYVGGVKSGICGFYTTVYTE